MSGFGAGLLALGSTLAIELPLALLLTRAYERRSVALTALFANLASHSLATALSFGLPASGAVWAALEFGVVVFETLALRFTAGLSWRRAGVLSLALNVPSAALALALA